MAKDKGSQNGNNGTATEDDHDQDNGGDDEEDESPRGGSRRDSDYVSNFLDRRFRGNARAAVGQLLRDNREYRETFRNLRDEGSIQLAADNQLMARDIHDLEQENKRLRRQTEGATVLKGDQLTEYKAFKALGLAPDKLKERVDLAARYDQEKAATARKTDAAKAAKKLGWDPETFAEYIEAKGLTVVMKDVDVEKRGKGGRKVTVTRSVPHLRPSADDKAEPQKARRFVEKNHRGWLAALEREQDDEADQDDGDDRDRDEGGEDAALDEEDEFDDDGDQEEEEDDDRREPSRSRARERGSVRLPSMPRGARKRGNRTPDVVGDHIKNTFVTPSQRRAQKKDG